MLLACLSFWNDPDRQFLDATPVGRETEERFEEVLRGYDAMGNSCIGLVRHLSQVAEAELFSEEVESALDRFFLIEEHQNLLRWLQVFCYLRLTNRRGANEAYSAMLDSLRDKDSATCRPLQILLDDKYPDIKGYLGYSDGGRFLRWQQLLESPIPPCFSATLLASFFNFRDALESLVREDETLHYGRVTRPSAVFWAAYGDATDSMALLLSKDYIDKFPLFRNPTNREGNHPSPLLEAVRLRENMDSRPGTYPTAMMLLDHGCRISDGFEMALLSSAPSSPGAREPAERVLQIPNAFTFHEDSLGGTINHAVFAGQSQILAALSKDKRLLNNLARGTPTLKNYIAESPKLRESPDYFMAMLGAASGPNERWISAMHLAGLNNDSRSIRLLCPSELAKRLSNLVGRNRWTPMHCAAQRGLESLRQKKGRQNESLTTVKTIRAEDHGVGTLLELSSDPALTDEAGNLTIHLAAYRGCEATISKLSQCHNEWDKMNEGKTPLAIALQLHHLDVAKVLLRKGASLDKVPDTIHGQFSIPREDASQEVNIEARRPNWLVGSLVLLDYEGTWR